MEFNYFKEWIASLKLSVNNLGIFWGTLIFGIIMQFISLIGLYLTSLPKEETSTILSLMSLQMLFFIMQVFGASFVLGAMFNSVKEVVEGKKITVSQFFKNGKKDFWEYLGFIGIVALGYIILIIVFSITAGIIGGIALINNSLLIFYLILGILIVLFLSVIVYFITRIIFTLPMIADFKTLSQAIKFSWKFPLKKHQMKTATTLVVIYIIFTAIIIPFFFLGVIPTEYKLTDLYPKYSTENIVLLAILFLISYLSLFVTIANNFFTYKAYKLYAPKAAKKSVDLSPSNRRSAK